MIAMMIGDVVGPCGVECVEKHLWKLRRANGIDLVVCNGENACEHNGIKEEEAQRLFAAGVDVITGGNHSLRQRDAFDFFDDCDAILRPVNLPSGLPGHGVALFGDAAVISVAGRSAAQGASCPFEAVDRALETVDKKIILVDFHAETTSEKRAFGFYLDGRVTAVCGTHTHVPTADFQILSGATAYITDLGMTGVKDSVLGVEKTVIIEHLKNFLPVKFAQAQGRAQLQAVIIGADDKTGKAVKIEQIFVD